MNRTILVFVLVLFGALTIPAIAQSGFSGFVTAITSSYASWQIFADLVIALTLVVVWMWRDAKSRGRNPWPWVVATALVGSFSPLIYLLTRRELNKTT